jgi:cell division protein ZapA
VGKRAVVVHIAGQRYVVRSDADEAYIQSLAGYVNERIEEVQFSSRPVSAPSLAVLAALNIADDLFRERQQRLELRKRIRDKSRAVLAYLDKEVGDSFQDHKGR